MITESRKPLSLDKIILLLASLIFVYIENKLFIASPGIIIGTLTFLYFSPWVLKHKSIILNIVFFCLIVLSQKQQSIIEIGKFLFMCGSFMLILHFRIVTKFPFISLSMFFVTELLLRIILGDSFGTLYAIKSTGGIFQDSNFTGLFIATILAAIFSNYRLSIRKYKFSSIRILSLLFFGSLLLLTFSRTSVIFLFMLVLSKYSIKLGLFTLLIMIITIPFIFLDQSISFGYLDGSLETKRKIFYGFIFLLSEGLEPILFGMGRDGAFVITEDASGGAFAGHTIFGQIVEFGLVLSFLYYYTAYLFIKKLYGDGLLFILIPFGAIAITSLSPLSYLGILSFLYYFSEKSMSYDYKKKDN